jgi:hypothetical protein
MKFFLPEERSDDKSGVVGVIIVGYCGCFVSTGAERELLGDCRLSMDGRREMIFDGELFKDLVMSSVLLQFSD